MSDDDGEMEDVGGSHADVFDTEPTKQDKIEVRCNIEGTLKRHHDEQSSVSIVLTLSCTR